MDFFSLKGKNAIVTGGNTGLGQAFSLALAKAGANLFIPTLVEESGETARMLENEGVKAYFKTVDITKKGAPHQIVSECVEQLGSVDILVNSAGISINVPVEEFGREYWDTMINVNLTAAFELGHEVASHMIAQRGGKIINICSLYSYLGGQWSPAYAATKHGLAGFTKAYCDELAQYNIQVNGLAPGYFATELTTKTRTDPDASKRILSHIPANRWGEVQELMGSMIYLASRASDYMNGHIMVVDGGFLVR
ncbi:MAG: SDR family oxidoreductase [Spirochaetota bacterium]